MTGALGSAGGLLHFTYLAMDGTGQLVSGAISAPSRREALAGVEKLALMPIEIDEHRPQRQMRGFFGRRVKPEDVTQATRDLAALLRGGVNLDRALLAVAGSQDLKSVAAIFKTVHGDVSAGQSLSEALSAHPQAFPAWYVKITEAAEANGRLADSLSLVARERARADALRRRATAALAYPVFLLVASIAVLCFVLGYVVPEFEKAFEGLGEGQRPDVIFVLSRSFRANADLLALLGIAALGAAMLSGRLAAVRAFFLRTLAAAPGMRRAFACWRAAVLCSNLSALMSGGVGVAAALKIASGLFPGDRAGVALEEAARAVRSGSRLSDALKEAAVLPGYAIHMLQVGERTGETPAALDRAALDYEERLDREIATITAIAGPAVLIAVSMMIAWIIISVMTALLGMNDLLLALGGFDGRIAWA